MTSRAIEVAVEPTDRIQPPLRRRLSACRYSDRDSDVMRNRPKPLSSTKSSVIRSAVYVHRINRKPVWSCKSELESKISSGRPSVMKTSPRSVSHPGSPVSRNRSFASSSRLKYSSRASCSGVWGFGSVAFQNARHNAGR